AARYRVRWDFGPRDLRSAQRLFVRKVEDAFRGIREERVRVLRVRIEARQVRSEEIFEAFSAPLAVVFFERGSLLERRCWVIADRARIVRVLAAVLEGRREKREWIR